MSKEKICESSPIELDIDPRAQWILQRSSTDTDLKPPLSKNNILLKYGSGLSQHSVAQSSGSNNWLSQIEILTHVGPHRRLWMGPQFIFKVCNNQSLTKLVYFGITSICIESKILIFKTYNILELLRKWIRIVN